jgi:hypothetical protein
VEPPTPPTPPSQPPPLPVTPPIRPPEAPAANASRLPLILLLLVLLAGAGATAWWFWPSEAPVVAEERPPTAPTPPPAPADPTETATPAEIAAMNLPPARVLEIAQRRQATSRHQDALLLLEVAAASRHAPAISALARLYDPETFAPGGALSAHNAIKAAELWRDAERAGDAAAAAPRAALRQRLEAVARDGDSMAALALRDFWP